MMKDDAKQKAEYVWGTLVAHRESTRLIWSPDVQHCNYFNRVLQNGF